MNQPCRGQSCVTCGLPRPERSATGHRAKPSPPERGRAGLGRTLLVGGMFALVLAGVAMRNREVTTVAPSIADHLPADAMIAGVYEVDPVELLDDWVARLDRFVDDGRTPFRDGLRELDDTLGLSFRDDVLAAFGPSSGFALAPAALDPASLAGWTDALPQGLLIALTVHDETSATVALTALLELVDGRLSIRDGRVTIELPAEGLTLYGTLRGRTLLLSGSESLLARATRGFPAGERLEDGADFATCRGQVDPDAELLTYVNLPRIRAWLRDGGLEPAAIEGGLGALFDDDWSGTGLMQTATRHAGGLRSTRFGPVGLGSGVLAAWTGVWSMGAGVGLVERWLRTADRPASREAVETTVETLRSVGAAVESYHAARGTYPITRGWIPIDLWRAELEPDHATPLQTTDGWGRTLLVWSDGASYRIVSPGLDGAIERDWSTLDHASDGPATGPAADIVFADGALVARPAG